MSPRERYTARGGCAVEGRIHTLIDSIRREVSSRAPRRSVSALVLFGGYGRGEGGVVRGPNGERPHNNLDFLLVSRGLDAQRRDALGQRLRPVLEERCAAHGVGADLSVVDIRRLRRTPPNVLLYDLRYGHKTVLGDPSWLEALGRVVLERVPATDVRHLLVNRGALLLINELLLDRAGDPEVRAAISRHAAKAVVGYGDALLFRLGLYHWSYREKQRRMQALTQIPSAFRELYDQAIEVRFEPGPDGWVPSDVSAWTRKLWSSLEPVHLAFEAVRLGQPDLRWCAYLDRASRRGIIDDAREPRAWLRKARSLLQDRVPSLGLSRIGEVGLSVGGSRAFLDLLFPFVAYRSVSATDRARAGRALRVAPDDRVGLVRAFLRAWGEHVDTGFAASARRLGLELMEDPS